MVICKKCGKEIDEGISFCPFCGSPVGYIQEPVQEEMEIVENGNESRNSVIDKIKSNKKVMLAVGAALVVVIILICAVSGNLSSSKMEKALKENDYQTVQIEYSNALGDSSELKKIDKLIASKLEDMIKDIDKYDFKDEAQSNTKAVDSWLAEYGTLMTPESSGGYYTCSDFPFNNCISINNQPLWSELCDKIKIAQEYCEGVDYYNQAEYYSAIERLSLVPEDSGCYLDSQDLINDSLNLYVEAIKKEADSYLQSGDYETAIETLNGAASRFKNNESISGYIDTINQKISEVKTKYAESCATKAEESFKKKDAYSAVSNINFALQLLPNNATYQASKAKYEQYLPFELYNADNVIKKDTSLYLYNSKTANNNEKMENVVAYSSAVTGENYTLSYTYNLEKKYDTISGTIFLPDDERDTKNQIYLVMYADGKKIYTSPYITAGFLPQKINVNVSDVNTLTIEAYCIMDSFQWFKSDFFVSNFVAQKEFK